jgi:hypothetical protein
MSVLDRARTILSSDGVLARIAIIFNAVTLIAIGFLTWFSQATANDLQRGENTITLLSGYTGGDVQKAQSAIRDFVIAQANVVTRVPLDQPAQSNRFIREFFPYIRHTEVVATCVEKALCLEDVIMSHSCVSIAEIFKRLDENLPDIKPKPSLLRSNTTKLLKLCEDYIAQNPGKF